jgi:hypothetical protein
MPDSPLIRVLSICDDDMVRSTRELVLRKDGYEIVSIPSNALLSVPEIRRFDVAVICHSVPPARAMGLVERLRRCKPEIRLLKINPRLPRVDSYYEVDSEVLAGPGVLLNGVRELLNRSAIPSPKRPHELAPRDEYCGPFAALPWTNVGALQRM